MKGFIHLDWAAIIDIICINEVKKKLCPRESNDLEYKKSIELAKLQLDSIGINIWKILGSPEYQELYDANESIFETIDKIRDGDKIDASIPDNYNIRRYKAKNSGCAE
jgi:hypothetical protein